MRRAVGALLLAAAVLISVTEGKKKHKPIRADLPLIRCSVCERLAASLHNQTELLPPPEMPQGRVASRGKSKPKGRVSEADLQELIEHVCSPTKLQGRWITRLDVISGPPVALVEHPSRGVCKRECRTIETSCSDTLEALEDADELQLSLWRGVEPAALEQKLCRQWTKACPPGAVGKLRTKDEEWEASPENGMEDLMEKLEGLGMGGQMFNREQLLAGDGPSDDDGDDDEL